MPNHTELKAQAKDTIRGRRVEEMLSGNSRCRQRGMSAGGGRRLLALRAHLTERWENGWTAGRMLMALG